MLGNKFIQIIGTQRSGSNLLRLMLNQLEEVSAPHPPHILKTFYPLLPKYGNLTDKAVFAKLTDNVCSWIELNPVPWHTKKFDRIDVMNRCDKPTLLNIAFACYSIEAENQNASFSCNKSMANVHYMRQIEEEGFAPYYIHLVRDGRDVALSFQNALIGEKHFYHLAKKWRNDQETAINQLKEIPETRQIHMAYEKLISEPHEVLQTLCDKIGLTYSDSMVNFYQSEDSLLTASSGQMWQNVAAPIISNNIGKYKAEVSQKNIGIFERVAGNMLTQLGYELNQHEVAGLNGFEQEEVQRFDDINNNMKVAALNTASPVDLGKRAAQQDLYKRMLIED